jgi:cytochrome c-type biogenesis protein CcmH
MFIVTIAILIFAMLFVLFPFVSDIKARRDKAVSQSRFTEHQNIALFEEQKGLFAAQLASGELDEQQYNDLNLGAEKLLLANTEATTSLSEENFSGGIWLLPCLLIALPIITITTYYHLGAQQDEIIKELIEEQSDNVYSNQRESLARNIRLNDALEKRVKQTPNNIYYWTLLAQFAISKNDFPKANDYFLTALQIDPQDSFLLAQYAESLFLVDQSKFTERVRLAVDKAYEVDPSNSTVLGLKGIEAYSKGKPAIAAKFWRKAQIGLDPYGSIYGGLQIGIEQAESLVLSSSFTESNDSFSKDIKQIVLTVSLHPSIPIKKNQIVFVAAIRPGDSKMPIAAKKISASRLPATIILSDLDSLMPGQNLSAVEEIQVVARLSSTGSATPQAGDWEAIGEPFALEEYSTEYKLIINSKRL